MPERAWLKEDLPCRVIPEVFFPEGTGAERYSDTERAKNICHKLCPVREDCLMWALEVGEVTDGIFGGEPPRTRRQMRRRLAPQMGWPEMVGV
jgi:WhiB family redox-sensing transcriptional regulator